MSFLLSFWVHILISQNNEFLYLENRGEFEICKYRLDFNVSIFSNSDVNNNFWRPKRCRTVDEKDAFPKNFLKKI